MPLLHFQDRFAGKVRVGSKLQTIRTERKRPIKPGDKLFLVCWIGKPYRSKTRLLRTEICKSVDPIVIVSKNEIRLKGTKLSKYDRQTIAIADGFSDTEEMIDWFQKVHGLPFFGVLIKWTGEK